MNSRTRSILSQADDDQNWEMPRRFPWKAELARIRGITAQVEALVGLPLELDDNVQDASHFAELTNVTEPSHVPGLGLTSYINLGIRFSAFGRLVAIHHTVEDSPLCATTLKELVEYLEAQGYVHISTEDLDQPYDGSNAFSEQISTWWDRYFDYC